MGKVSAEVCEICRQESCDGKIYETQHMHGSYGFDMGRKVVCSSNENLVKTDIGISYRLVSGHGDISYFDVRQLNKKFNKE